MTSDVANEALLAYLTSRFTWNVTIDKTANFGPLWRWQLGGVGGVVMMPQAAFAVFRWRAAGNNLRNELIHQPIDFIGTASPARTGDPQIHNLVL